MLLMFYRSRQSIHKKHINYLAFGTISTSVLTLFEIFSYVFFLANIILASICKDYYCYYDLLLFKLSLWLAISWIIFSTPQDFISVQRLFSEHSQTIEIERFEKTVQMLI